MKALLIFLSLFVFVTQIEVEFKTTKDSTISIHGTSTLHDWQMESQSVDATASIAIKGNEIMISSFEGSLPVETLKSEKNGINKNAYKALDSKTHDTISFSLKEIVSRNTKDNTVLGLFNVTVSGVTREMQISGNTELIDKQTIRITGSTELKMTDFDVEPPSLMFGTIKTGDELDIRFDLQMAVSSVVSSDK